MIVPGTVSVMLQRVGHSAAGINVGGDFKELYWGLIYEKLWENAIKREEYKWIKRNLTQKVFCSLTKENLAAVLEFCFFKFVNCCFRSCLVVN